MFAVLNKFTGKLEIKTCKHENVIRIICLFYFTYLCPLSPTRLKILDGRAYIQILSYSTFFFPVSCQCYYSVFLETEQICGLQFFIYTVLSRKLFFSIIPKDEYFHFPKSNTLNYIMKYTFQGSFSPIQSKFLFILIFFFISTGFQKQLPTFPSGI